ncbi:MAG: polymerase beta, Nucleotidyltransferase [Candidatus Parcubacteria bacterium]|jgi:predicted nucleotidyltransferase
MESSSEVQSVIEVAQRHLLERVPKSEILAVYLKGSQAHGMTNANSDIDLVVILKSDEYFSVVYDIRKEVGPTTQPPFSYSAYTLDELRTGKFLPNRPPISGVSRFVKHLDALPLVYGERPPEPLFRRSDEKDLEINIRNFHTIFFPAYDAKTISFSELVKQVLWLAEAEARVRGANVAHSWRGAVAALPDAHIAHEALKYRVSGDPILEKQEEFLEKLKAHLSTLAVSTS